MGSEEFLDVVQKGMVFAKNCGTSKEFLMSFFGLSSGVSFRVSNYFFFGFF